MIILLSTQTTLEEVVLNSLYMFWQALGQGRYALEVGPKILRYFEDYFGIKFPLPKIDMVALPDFSAGAMENWGLITYRLLYSIASGHIYFGASYVEILCL